MNRIDIYSKFQLDEVDILSFEAMTKAQDGSVKVKTFCQSYFFNEPHTVTAKQPTRQPASPREEKYAKEESSLSIRFG